MLLTKSISYFMNIMYKHIFLNFGVIPFINKEMVSFNSTAHLKVWPSVCSTGDSGTSWFVQMITLG